MNELYVTTEQIMVGINLAIPKNAILEKLDKPGEYRHVESGTVLVQIPDGMVAKKNR